jgi:hypothetical protein
MTNKHDDNKKNKERTIILHLNNGDLKDRQKGKGRAHDGQNAAAQEQLSTKDGLGSGNGEFGDLDQTANAASDEGGTDRVLFEFSTKGKAANGKTRHDEWRRDQTADHGKSVLQSHEQGHDERQRLVYAWCMVGGLFGRVRDADGVTAA